MLDTPQFIQTDVQLTAVIHLTVPRAEISVVMGPAITEITSTIAAQASHYHRTVLFLPSQKTGRHF